MELLKNVLVLRGGGGGGNSIDIEEQSISGTAEKILDAAAKMETAFTNANAAVESALAAFDEGDSNKATLKKVLTNGTSDISSAIATVKEFATRMTESSTEWSKAEQEIAEALAAAGIGSGTN